MEVLIAITIGTIVVGSAVSALLLTTSSNTQNRATQLATSYEQELMGNLRSVAESNWSQIYGLTTKGPSGIYYLATYQQLPGTVSVTSSSTAVNGTGTNFTSSLVAGDNITINAIPFTVGVVNSDTLLTLNTVYPGTSTSSLNLYRNFSIRTGKETLIANNITFSRWFSIQNVFRDTCGVGTITSTATACTVSSSTGAMMGVLEDPSTQQLTVNVTWSNGQGSYTVNQYISRTRDQVIRINDWSGGVNNSTNTVFTQPTNQYATSTGLSGTTTGVLQLSQ